MIKIGFGLKNSVVFGLCVGALGVSLQAKVYQDAYDDVSYRYTISENHGYPYESSQRQEFKTRGKSGVIVGVNAGASFVDANYLGAIYRPASVVNYEMIRVAPDFESGYGLGLLAGYKHYFGRNWGVKGYVDYHFSHTFGYKAGLDFNTTPNAANPIDTTADVTRYGHLLVFNADVFFNYGALGAYIGLGLGFEGYHFTSLNSSRRANSTTASALDGSETLDGGFQAGFALPLNLGLSFDINANNQVSIGAKIPLVAQSYDYTKSVASSLNPVSTFSGSAPTFRNYLVEFGYTYTF